MGRDTPQTTGKPGPCGVEAGMTTVSDVLQRYPMMEPYVGDRFGETARPAILLVGESHYLPEGSTQHLTPESWYGNDHTILTDKERKWINTARIIERSREEEFKNPAHSIWKNSLKVLNSAGPQYQDLTDACGDIAFCNFFLRPGREGESLKGEVERIDVELASDRLKQLIASLEPSHVVFLSSFARRKFRSEAVDVPIEATPHPGSPWWNRTAKKYGDRRGRDVLRDLVQSVWNPNPDE